MQQQLVAVVLPFLNEVVMKKTLLAILFSSLIVSPVYAQSQPSGLAVNTIKRQENFKNKT